MLLWLTAQKIKKSLAAECVLSGDKPAIWITEPGAGSAATLMTTRADKKGELWILNGGKTVLEASYSQLK